ncbi:MAG: ATP-dependent DNA helicase [Planctomycetes bacterium]|nr:ATP-dependent DNA helicase [Planctomycetota bacterium]
MNLRDLLGPDGPIARAHPAFEARREQVQMMTAVENALRKGGHLIVEAGTGVGKTFAYLLPVLRHALDTKKPVMVSTHTINLQEQLLTKDVPFLRASLGWEFTAALGMGRSNYLCRRRFDLARQEGRLFRPDAEELERIEAWARSTADGTRQDLNPQPRPAAWSLVASEAGNCMGDRSPHFDDCFYQRAVRRLRSADLLVLNHHLFFSDLVLRERGINYLPQAEVAVLDEAHTLEEVAHAHFGIDVSNLQVRYLLNALFNPRRGSGFLATRGDGAAREAVESAEDANARFFEDVTRWLATHPQAHGRLRQPRLFQESLSRPLGKLAEQVEALLPTADDEAEEFEIQAYATKARQLADGVRAFVEQAAADHVYWMEASDRSERVTLRASPIDVGALLKKLLFDRYKTVILTSATLGIGKDHSLDYVKRSLGVEAAAEVQVGSPFDYARQAKLHIARGMPEPSDVPAYLAALPDRILRYLRQSHGRAFVLFTNTQHMNRTYDVLSPRLAAEGIAVRKQGDDLGRRQLLEWFKGNVGSVLFGLDSFWQGVDVPGEALENVILTKLPFPVPSEPLVEAKSEAINARGGNAFMDYLLPETIIKVRQGFGRLIRSRTDKGIVVILDRRVLTKRYGQLVLDSLPACPRVVED